MLFRFSSTPSRRWVTLFHHFARGSPMADNFFVLLNGKVAGKLLSLDWSTDVACDDALIKFV
jgi:hypothetical protein